MMPAIRLRPFRFLCKVKTDIKYVNCYLKAEAEFSVSACICIIHAFLGMSIKPYAKGLF